MLAKLLTLIAIMLPLIFSKVERIKRTKKLLKRFKNPNDFSDFWNSLDTNIYYGVC